MSSSKINDIKVLGHRGTKPTSEFHENTLPAFLEGLKESDGIETDAVISNDDVPFLIHLSSARFSLARLFFWAVRDFRSKIEHYTADVIEQHTLKPKKTDNHSIPRLRHLFEIASGNFDKIINIDLKAERSIKPVIEEIHSAVKDGLIKKDQIILSSFDHDQIAEAKSIDPSIKRGLIYYPYRIHSGRLYPKSKESFSRYKHLNLKNINSDHAKKADPDYFMFPITKKLSATHALAVKQQFPRANLVLWSPRKEPLPEKNKALNQKLEDLEIAPFVKAIITDHPKEMKAFLKP
jgi:glycerophosphoryl diester phosphodiesterase